MLDIFYNYIVEIHPLRIPISLISIIQNLIEIVYSIEYDVSTTSRDDKRIKIELYNHTA